MKNNFFVMGIVMCMMAFITTTVFAQEGPRLIEIPAKQIPTAGQSLYAFTVKMRSGKSVVLTIDNVEIGHFFDGETAEIAVPDGTHIVRAYQKSWNRKKGVWEDNGNDRLTDTLKGERFPVVVSNKPNLKGGRTTKLPGIVQADQPETTVETPQSSQTAFSGYAETEPSETVAQAGQPETTAAARQGGQTVPVPAETAPHEIGKGLFPQFTGLYFKKYKSFTMYLKFFPDGHVISANISGKYDSTVKEWLNKTYTDNQGTYSVDGNNISFFVEAEEGKVEYQGSIIRKTNRNGVIKRDVMKLELHSLINGKKRTFKFGFI